MNAVYLIKRKSCLEQYLGSATNFVSCFRIIKKDIKTKKENYETARHFTSTCRKHRNPCEFFSVKITEKVLGDF